MKNDKDYINRAIALGRSAMQSDQGGPFGAVVVLDGVVLGEGSNSVTSHNDPTAHAEINAIRQACAKKGDYTLEGAVIYTSCEPCPMCLGAIYWARISKVVYAATREDAKDIAGFDDDHFYEEMNASWEQRSIENVALNREDGIQLFREWSSKSDRKMY